MTWWTRKPACPAKSERWHFTRLGDIQVLLRRQSTYEDGATSVALFGGLNWPTGPFDVANDSGVRAERALQPGSGTIGLIIGVAARRAMGGSDALIGQAALTQALNEREGFDPANVSISLPPGRTPSRRPWVPCCNST